MVIADVRCYRIYRPITERGSVATPFSRFLLLLIKGQSMPKRKKGSKGRIFGLLLGIIIVALLVIAWHDGIIGATAIEDINGGNVSNGTVVTVKGELIYVLGNSFIVTPPGGGFQGLLFTWVGWIPPQHSTVVVTGTVSSVLTLSDVTSLRAVIIFR